MNLLVLRTLLLTCAALCAVGAVDAEKPRLVVLTDIGNEPDDAEAMVRLLNYSNEVDIEALIATTSRHLTNQVRPDDIRFRIGCYGQVRDNLLLHAPGFPTADHLLSLVTAGLPRYGMEGVGADKDSEGSNRLIAVVDRADARPVHVTVWGGPNVLAQALFRVRASRTPAQLAAFVAKMRVYAICDQDDSGDWIRTNFPDLFYIVRPGTNYDAATWPGISAACPGSDFNLVNNAWIHEHVQTGHGPLGASYPYLAFIMEGDTPSWFYSLPIGPGDPAHPDWGGWGGRFEHRDRGLWSDTTDRVRGIDGQWYKTNKATIWRWREAYQNDFQARMDWNVMPAKQANHPPRVAVAGGLRRSVTSGQRIKLDASASSDPDGDTLSWKWWLYAEPSHWDAGLDIDGASSPRAEFTAPAVFAPTDLHIMLEVTDGGKPRLTRYARVIVTVHPGSTPLVSAGPDLLVVQPEVAHLDGKASDDGHPPALVTTWSKVSGPGVVAFANAAATATTATFADPGEYVLRLTASHGAETRSDQVMVRVLPPGPISFVAGVNLNGGAVTIDGNRWWSHDEAVAAGLQVSAPFRHVSYLEPVPATDADTRAMLNSAVWSQGDVAVSLPLPAGYYDVRLWVMENFQAGCRSFAINIEGQCRADAAGALPLGGWAVYGPYHVGVRDGRLDVALASGNGDPHLMGLSVHRLGGPDVVPTVSAAPATPSPPRAAPPSTAP